MPTAQDILDAAFLSKLAYSHNPPVASGNWTVLSRSELGMTQAEWDNDSTDADNSQTLFDNLNAQCVVALSADGKSLAIAFRGTLQHATAAVSLGEPNTNASHEALAQVPRPSLRQSTRQPSGTRHVRSSCSNPAAAISLPRGSIRKEFCVQNGVS